MIRLKQWLLVKPVDINNFEVCRLVLPRSPVLQVILYQLSHKGSPRILEWVAHPFSSGSSQPRNQTGVSCIAGGFFTN